MTPARLWFDWWPEAETVHLVGWSTSPVSPPTEGAKRYVLELELPSRQGEVPKVHGIRGWLSPDDDNFFASKGT